MFSLDGKLVATALNKSLYLGSIQYATQHQHKLCNTSLQPKDALLPNRLELGCKYLLGFMNCYYSQPYHLVSCCFCVSAIPTVSLEEISVYSRYQLTLPVSPKSYDTHAY